MTQAQIRLWPGVVAAVVGALIWLGAPLVSGEPLAGLVAVLGGLVAALSIVVWWAFFSRAPGAERWGAVVLILVALALTPRILDESIAAGNLGFQFFIYAVPTVSFTLVVWAVASRRLSLGARRASMVAAILLASGVWALLRSDGVTGGGMPEFAWRWSATAEERLLAHVDADVLTVLPPPPAGKMKRSYKEAEWPGFRGPARDGVIPGLRIDTDWAASPPVELWRRPIGPGVSSFAIQGNLLYTQEQRGENEIVRREISADSTVLITLDNISISSTRKKV